MEAFSLLKYWRVGGSNGVNKTTEKQLQQQQPTTTIATTVSEMSVEEEECVVDGDADDEGPFFDLEFAVPNDEDDNNGGGKEKDDYDDGDSVTTDEDEEEEDGFDFTVSPGSVSSGGNQIDSSSSPNNLTFSPSDDIFFKGDVGKSVSPLFQSSSSTTSTSSSVENGLNNNPKVQFPVSFIKTATKIRVFMLGFKSNSSNPKPKSEDQKPEEKQSTIRTELKQSKKFVTVKFRVDELLPMISLFTRDSSSSSATASNNNKIMSSSQEEIEVEDEEGKKLISKDVVQKYLKMIKPLYVRVSKRYNNNGGGAFSPSRSMDNSSVIPSSPLPIKIEDEISSKRKQGVSNLPNGFRIVRKHLGKSRSASSVNPVTTNSSSPGGIQAKRRDDSLLQQQDGIQSAILHCKRSFNASRDTDSCPRSSTESHETSIDEAAAGK